MKKHRAIIEERFIGNWHILESNTMTSSPIRFVVLKINRSKQKGIKTADLIRKLDSLREEPGMEYSTSHEARQHLRMLMQS